IRAIEAQAQTKVKSEFLSHAPVVLEVRFDDVIAVVIFCLKVDLRKRRDFACEKVSESVTCAAAPGNGTVAGIERQNTLNVRRVLLVLLRKRQVGSESQGVSSQDFGDVVTISVGRIRIVPREVARVGAKSTPIGGVVAERDRRKLAAKAVVKENAH